MATCRALEKAISELCSTLSIELPPEIQQAVGENTEEFLAGVIAAAEVIAAESKHKIISTEDIMAVIERRGLPFAEILRNDKP